jgi:hypothetical protein
LSHMVIYRTADGQPGYHQAGELDEAVRFVERLRNGDGVDGARIFRMEEVNFDFRPYFKVEIGPGDAPIESAAPAFTADSGFATDLGFGADSPTGGYATGETWAEPEVDEAPVESDAAISIEAEPEPAFAAPAFSPDASVIDALPSQPPAAEPSGFEPPSVPPVELPSDDGEVVSARRGLFGR